MFIGFLFACIACLIWGTVFVIPTFLEEFSPIEVTLGRYLSYGVVSSAIFFTRFGKLKKTPLKIWVYAAFFGLAVNILYYLGVVIGLRYATPPLTILLLGLAPITIALYGNYQTGEFKYKNLVIPSIWILLGLFLVNVAEIDWSFTTRSPQDYLIGLAAGLGALVSWTLYAVHNARFLRAHPEIKNSDWTTLLGIGTLFWVVLFTIMLASPNHKMIDFSKFTELSPALYKFLGGILFLGSMCSWVGSYLWNRASGKLPISIAGAFIILETLFGLVFVYLVEQTFPSTLELLGIASMLGGILSAYFACRNHAPIHS